MGCECINCRFSSFIVDSHEELILLCGHCDSDNYLKRVGVGSDKCELGQMEEDEG